MGIAIGSLLSALDTIITENIRKELRGTVSSFYSSARFIGVAAGHPIVKIKITEPTKASSVLI